MRFIVAVAYLEFLVWRALPRVLKLRSAEKDLQVMKRILEDVEARRGW